MGGSDILMIGLVVAGGAYVLNLLCAPLNLCFSGLQSLGVPAAAAAPSAPATGGGAGAGYPAGYSAAAYRSYAAHMTVA
jgi:hypothetical protein